MTSVLLQQCDDREELRMTHQCNPEDDVLVDEAVEVLVKEEEARTYECGILKMELTLGHVGHLEERNIRDITVNVG